MLRRCSCVIGLAVMLVGLPTAQAADTTLMLACKGTETSGVGARKSSEVVNIGIIVDLQKKTVTGLSDDPLSFHGMRGSWDNKRIVWSMSGTLTE
jgi:hypothetical protein